MPINTTYSAELFVDDVSYGILEGGTPADFTNATLLLGHGSGVGTPATETYFDDAQIIKSGSVPLLVNSDFESALTAYPDVLNFDPGGNWRGRIQNHSPILDWSTAHAHSPTHSAYVKTFNGGGGGFWYQDLDLSPNNVFDIDLWIYPVQLAALNGAHFEILFNWDRGGGTTAAAALVAFNQTSFQWSAWGVGTTTPITLSLNDWHHIVLSLTAAVPQRVPSLRVTQRGDDGAGGSPRLGSFKDSFQTTPRVGAGGYW